MHSKKVILTFASSLLLRTFSFGTAAAQVALTCPQNISIGSLISCGSGRFRIQPNGVGTGISGCANAQVPPVPQPAAGRCTISTSAPLTKSVRAEFVNPAVTINNPPATFQMERWRMASTGNPNTSLTKMTFTPTQVGAGVTIQIGAEVVINSGQAVGSYTGRNSVTTSLLP